MINNIKRERHGLVCSFSGDITLSDIEKANHIFHTDENFERLKYSIWDFMNCNFNKISLDDMMGIVAADLGASNTLKTAHKTAIITTDAYIIKACTHYIKECSKHHLPWITGIFSNIDEAREWTER